ncbi:MAG: hypothetical protein JSV49_05805 [Thermoplasmata archaeon]|nr:MAG: hypothetical protein JSV49_05805 [Thermoplasmata archaeon]
MNKAVSMPEVNQSWNQSDWSGGSDQSIWSDPTKFSTSNNLNYLTAGGKLELDAGNEIQAWKRYGDGPSDRYRHQISWAPSKQLIYLFGGLTGSGQNPTPLDNLYEYNPELDKWTEINDMFPPSARGGHVQVWDDINDLLWVYGGRGASWNTKYNDLHSFDPDTKQWSQWVSGPCLPRHDAAGAFDPVTQQIIIWGGYTTAQSDNPSAEVFAYNVSSNAWTQMKNFTRRYYQDAVWCPITKTVFFYGGARGWSGNNYIYVDQLNEYFPQNDTWVNRTSAGNRVRPLVAWDTYNERLMMYGGYYNGLRNDTWHYNVETRSWTQKKTCPTRIDYTDGDWDDVNNQFVYYGGTYWGISDETWAYLPNATGYKSSGELISSAFNPGHYLNLRSLSFNLSKPLPPGLSEKPVKIQLASSMDSAESANNFIGPYGYSSDYFYKEEGQATSSKLDKSKYLTYKVNISAGDMVYTPRVNWIQIDYFTYPTTYEYISGKYNMGAPSGIPLRLVEWDSIEQNETSIEIYIRQGNDKSGLDSKTWEKVSLGQSIFGFKEGTYFQYKALFKTTDAGLTATLSSITFTFNELPAKPKLSLPVNDTWVGDSKPQFTWLFSDPDESDYQTGFEINVASDYNFKTIWHYFKQDSTNSTFKATEEIEDGKFYWRARVKDNYGSWSSWSDMYIINIDTKKPLAPKIVCFTHELEHIYYSKTRCSFDWNEPLDDSGITGYGYTLDRSPDIDPPLNISMTLDEYNIKHTSPEFEGLVIYDNLEDGTWYFHLKAVDLVGYWSDTVTRMIKIDTKSPEVNDLTPNEVLVGAKFDFKFDFNDTDSGINEATITWRYSSEIDYRYDTLLPDENIGGLFTLPHQLEKKPDPFIEYYINVYDLAEPRNERRYPVSGYEKIDIIDNGKPELKDVKGDFSHNRYNDLVITVTATDNVGISKVIIYFNDESTSETMSSASGNKYSITIDRMKIPDLTGYGGDNIIRYRIEAWDFGNNSDIEPQNGNFNITIIDPDAEGTDESEETKEKEQWLTPEMTINLIVLIAIIIFVAILLFIFIRKQSEKMSEDRHKLRMAIADVHEAAAAGSPAPLEGLEAPAEAQAGLPGQEPQAASQAELPDVIEIPAGAPAPVYTPSLDAQVTPVGYLPEALQPVPGESVKPPETQRVSEEIQTKTDEDKYRKAGLMMEPKEPGAAPDSVQVQEGLSVSLPGEAKPDVSETEPALEQPTMTPTQSAREFDEALMWKPPEASMKIKESEKNKN